MVFSSAVADAQREDASTPVDAARQNERYVIQPGAESLFAEMLGRGETLPGGCTLSDGKIERGSVLATYTCGGHDVVLELLHAASARSGDVRTERFAVTVKSGAPPAGLVEAVADRIRTREAAFQWTEIAGVRPPPQHWRVGVAGGVLIAIALVAWAARGRIARRQTQPGGTTSG